MGRMGKAVAAIGWGLSHLTSRGRFGLSSDALLPPVELFLQLLLILMNAASLHFVRGLNSDTNEIGSDVLGWKVEETMFSWGTDIYWKPPLAWTTEKWNGL